MSTEKQNSLQSQDIQALKSKHTLQHLNEPIIHDNKKKRNFAMTEFHDFSTEAFERPPTFCYHFVSLG